MAYLPERPITAHILTRAAVGREKSGWGAELARGWRWEVREGRKHQG